MKCDTCARWIVARNNAYDDGIVVETFKASEGKGYCESLEIDTLPAFGCTGYSSGANQVRVSVKPGKPWNYFKMGPCPDCAAHGNSGDGACHRCAGTGQVRHYEDGHVGEERTRLHPREREQAGKPKCAGCGKEVEPDWMACPRCAHRLDAAAAVERVADPLFQK